MKVIYWIAGTGFLLSAMALDSESMTPTWICAGCVTLLAIGLAKNQKLHRCNRKERHDRRNHIRSAEQNPGKGADSAV